MKHATTKAATRGVFAFVLVLSAWGQVRAAESQTAYPTMAPLEQYMMERGAEIALAQSAAPTSVSGNADVMVMGAHGYETAVKGTNGFVCLVERSWTTASDDPEFWNPKVRAPICFNPAAARSVVPLTLKKTDLVLAGRSKPQMFEDLKTVLAKKEIPALEVGAMCYMMSKQGNLNDHDGHWHPHLMFFLPPTDPSTWGANLPGSPIYGSAAEEDHLVVFFVPVAKWSDGTPGTMGEH